MAIKIVFSLLALYAGSIQSTQDNIQTIRLSKNLEFELHSWAQQANINGLSEENQKKFYALLEKKIDINQEMEHGATPLSYCLANMNHHYDPLVFSLILHHGAQLRPKKPSIEGHMKNNAISFAIDPYGVSLFCCLEGNKSDSRIWREEKKPFITQLVAHLLHERLHKVKKDCFILRLVCNYMNKKYRLKTPRLLIESMMDTMLLQSSDAYDDIQMALLQKDYPLSADWELGWKFGSAEEKIEHTHWLKYANDLRIIVSITFWQQPFKNIAYLLKHTIEKYASSETKN